MRDVLDAPLPQTPERVRLWPMRSQAASRREYGGGRTQAKQIKVVREAEGTNMGLPPWLCMNPTHLLFALHMTAPLYGGF